MLFFGYVIITTLVLAIVLSLYVVLPLKWFLGIVVLGVLLLAVPFVWNAIFPWHPDRALIAQGNSAIGEKDASLLRMALSEEISQSELDAFLRDWDIEAAPIKSVMLLAYLMKTRPDLAFPPSITPRLDGVLTFCRFQNLKREAHFTKVCRALKAEEIPFLILKGGAMKVYRPDFPRWMNDIDVLVPSEDFQRAVDTAITLGYNKPMFTDHSVDLHFGESADGLLDIHKHLEMFTGNEELLNDGFFGRALPRVLFSVEGLLPCEEDMVFIALVNLYKNLAKNQTPESSLTTFYDIKWLLSRKPDFDWSVIVRNARLTGVQFQVLYSTKIVESIVGRVFPQDWEESLDLPGKMFDEQLTDFLFRRDILSTSRDSFKQTSVGESLSINWNIGVFIWAAAVSLVKKISKVTSIKAAILRVHYKKHDHVFST